MVITIKRHKPAGRPAPDAQVNDPPAARRQSTPPSKLQQWQFYLLVLAGLLIVNNIFPFQSTITELQGWTSTAIQTTRDGLLPVARRRDFCTRSQIRNGQWVPVRLEKPPYIPENDHSNCYMEENGTNLLLQSPWDTYEWQPFAHGECQFPSFSNQEFCSLVANKTILFLGDSIIREQYLSLVHLFGWRGNRFKVAMAGEYHICNDTTRVLFKKDWYLARVKTYLDYNQPQIVVMNRGLNFQPNDDVLLGELQAAFGQVQEWYDGPACNSSNATCLVVWKTSVPGHPTCQQFDKPVNNIAAMESLINNASLSESPEIFEKWGWYAQKRQNAKTLASFANAKNLQEFLEIIDAYQIQIQRPDLHRAPADCLHNCPPGKTEVMNQILLQILRARFQMGESYDEGRLSSSDIG